MADHLIRVVHYPEWPDDLGVVGREDGGLVVYWATGEADDVTECGRLAVDHQWARSKGLPTPPRLPTVTRRAADLRRVYAQHRTAFAREVDDG